MTDLFRRRPPSADALWFALRIQRGAEPKTWPTVLRSVPQEFRGEAETYLRGIASRMRVLQSIKPR